jgi:biopolymer transport protein ExbD
MLKSWRTPRKLFRDFNTLQFGCVMGMVVFAMLLVFMTMPTSHHGISAGLPKVLHPVSMRGADREDALKVYITRAGKVYFGASQVDVADLHGEIAERLKDRDVEHQVYIVADMRARWGTIKPVLDAVRAAGILGLLF